MYQQLSKIISILKTNNHIHTALMGTRVVLILLLLSMACDMAMAQEQEYKHREDYTALVAQLPNTRHSLSAGIEQVSRSPETAISAKFELKGGKLMLSVYTAGKGLEQDAEHNVLKEYIGSPLAEKWTPETEVFEDVAHVARSAQYVALMRMASVSLLDVIQRSSTAGTVFSIKPMVVDGHGRFVVQVVQDNRVRTLEYDLSGHPADEDERHQDMDDDDEDHQEQSDE